VGEPEPIEPPQPAPPVASHRLRRLSIAALAVAVVFVAGLVGYSRLPSSHAGIPLSVSSAGTPTPLTSSTSFSPRPSPPPSPSLQPSRVASTRSSPAASSASANTSGRDLALDGTATASSLEGPGTGRQASYAIDGDPATRWSSGFSDPQWLRVDLGARWQISEIRLNWENAHATAYRVELSTDGTTWKPVYRTSNGQAGETTVKVAKLPARFVRVYGTKRSTDYGYSLWELEVR
jgi:hypothetical protein